MLATAWNKFAQILRLPLRLCRRLFARPPGSRPLRPTTCWRCRHTPVPDAPQRLLAIYDLRRQPFSIGDILIVQEAALVVRERKGLEFIDFAVVYDAKQPTCGDPAFARITEENVLYHLASILPAAQVNAYHGSLFLFNSHQQLECFLKDNARRYEIWPPNWHPDLRDYLYYNLFNDLLYNYHCQHGRIPYLQSRKVHADWAHSFVRNHIAPRIPVTVQIRNNKHIGQHRNVDLDSWLSFFRHCETRYPATFIIICALSEIDLRLRECRNVILAKDFGTGIEQDLALIETAAIHMGASSGPGTIAMLNPNPFLLVNVDWDPANYRGLIREGSFYRLSFCSPLQRFGIGRESAEMLIAEFDRMWQAVDHSRWVYGNSKPSSLSRAS